MLNKGRTTSKRGCAERRAIAVGYWQAFRSNSPETRIALVVSWAVGAGSVGLSVRSRLIAVDGSTDTVRVLAEAIVAAIAVIVFAGVQLALCHGSERPRWTYVLLGLGLLPLAWGVPSTTLAYGYAAALASLSARGVAVAIVGSGFVFALLFNDGGGVTSVELPMVLLELTISAIVLAAITHLAVLANRLRVARELLARRHVDLERERVGRHVHDVLGRTLVAASLRNQTLLRTLGDDKSQVSDELEQLQETLSTGQQRIRAAASGPAITSWTDEVSAARMLCQRIGIELSTDVSGAPAPQHHSLIGMAIRESITNVLKHSRATLIDLRVASTDDETLIRVVNDGVRRAAPSETPPESRLRGAVERGAGSLTMGVSTDDHYFVEISLPKDPGRSDLSEELP